MNGHPVMVRPQHTSRIIAFGTTGIVCQSIHDPKQVIKAPLRYNVQGCSTDVIDTIRHEEAISIHSIEREKLIYKTLPKDSAILDCIAITDRGIHLPFMPFGNLREYLHKHDKTITSQTKERWILTAIHAISLIHRFGIVHADISARNFLVADDLSIKLCDFAGSAIGDKPSLAKEEDRYQIDPEDDRSIKTDIFALGCLIFEIVTGLRPYDEIHDNECNEIRKRYARGQFPCLEGVLHGSIIYRCWTAQYKHVSQLECDMLQKPQKGILSRS